MKSFNGKIAVITGGGTGMGRVLARQLAEQGAHIAMCDVSAENMAETARLCREAGPRGLRVSTFVADVSDEDQVRAFRDATAEAQATNHVHLLFNNAGIGGGGSFVRDERAEWDKTFGVCWSGVYYCSRAFLPLLLAAPEAHLVNTSSVNGFWAWLGPGTAHTAYSAAKFAVKGFSEALVNDLRLYAPHVKVSVVMPGHIGTSIAINSRVLLEPHRKPGQLREQARTLAAAMGADVDGLTDEQLEAAMRQREQDFRDHAPLTAAQAAEIILDGVRHERWRILVGDDAHALDRLVRDNPEGAYEPEFMDKVRAETDWRLGRD